MKDTEQSPEVRVDAENTYTEMAPRSASVKLVEMGDVSVETKGFARGLELGLTPRG